MRIASGDTSRKIGFVAVDSTDFATRETGLSSFTVYRSRDGGTATAYTTPTIAELDSTNMPGCYVLTVDEDTTITSGVDSEEIMLHITHAGMAPVTRTIELYRPKITAGNTLGVAADGDISGNVDGSVASVTGAVGSVTGAVGSISGVTFPTNFGDLAITATTGLVDVNDKSGYSISGTLTTLDALDTAQDAQHSTTQGLITTVGTVVDAILVDTGTTIPGQLDSMSGATFDTATDSLEAIRNRGDAAWTTGAGGTPPQLLQNTTIATLASQTSFTLTAGSADDDAYNGAVVVVTDSATSTQKCVGSVSDYVGSTKTVTLSADPGVFTMAAGDTIDIIANASTAPSAAAVRAEIDANSTQLAAIVEDTGTTIPAQISALNNLSAAQVNAEVDTALADYDGPTNAEMVAAFTEIKGATWDATNTLEAIHDDQATMQGNVTDILADTADMQPKLGTPSTSLAADIAAVPTATQNADALLNRDMSAVSDTTARSPLNALRFLRNKYSVSGTTLTVTKEDDTTSAWTSTLTTDAAAEPVTGSDPA